MSDSKVFMFPETGASNSGLISMLAPLLSQKGGIDPNLLLAMNNRNDGCWGGEGGWFMWIIFLFFLMGWGNGGWSGYGNRSGFGGEAAQQRFFTDSLITNDAGRDLLMSAIQGNGNAIGQLATTLNCSIGDIQTAINGVMGAVQNVGNQVGMSSQQIINAVQAGNCQIGSQLAQCCCDVRESVTRMGYESQLANERQTYTLSNNINTVNNSVERGFASTAFETQAQTCSLQNTIRDISTSNTNQIVAKLDAMQSQALQDKITALREKNSEQAVIINNAQQSALFGQMIGQATAPINAALTGLTKEVADIQCKLPQTVTLPYSCATAVPTCLAAQYGLYGNGVYGAWG